MIWRSTYKESLGEAIAHSLTSQEKDIFCMLWGAYNLTTFTRTSYFELLRVGDGKYELTVQKYVDESICVKFTRNDKYANKAERFTK